jgi:hypothetical protein
MNQYRKNVGGVGGVIVGALGAKKEEEGGAEGRTCHCARHSHLLQSGNCPPKSARRQPARGVSETPTTGRTAKPVNHYSVAG